MRAIIRQVRIAPKKANLVAGLVRNTNAETSLAKLKYMPKKAARILYKLVASAVANAENNFGKDKASLTISKIVVTAGPMYKRGQSHAKGRVTPILKRTSHITVELEVGEAVAKKTKKKGEKEIKEVKGTKEALGEGKKTEVKAKEDKKVEAKEGKKPVKAKSKKI